MNDCLFCKIIDGSIPSKKIYEDDKILVFMDINPNTNADLLMIPKKHYVTINDVDNDTLIHMIDTIKNKMIPLLKDKLNIDGLTLIQNNGEGQEIKHFHIHLTSRYTNDDLRIESNKDILKELDEVHNILTN